MSNILGELDDSLVALRLAAESIREKREAAVVAEQRMLEREAALECGWQAVKAKEEELTKHEEDAQATLKEKDEEIASRENWVECKRRKLEDEKEAMMKLGAGKNDIVGLNFGGEQVVQVKRSLLLQFEDSMLASMFSGRHDDTLDRDTQGNFFLDYSPKVMCPLIDFLRLSRDMTPKPVPLPEIPQEDETAWKAMIDFMGLQDVLIPPRPKVTFFSGIKENVKISDLQGWTPFFCQPYSHRTRMEDFLPLDTALRGGALLVGARRAGADVLALAAMGDADVVTRARADGTTTLHNGAHWYCKSGRSVGFSPSPRVDLNSADVMDLSSQLRLSWHLYRTEGGWRAGSVCKLNESTDWEKVIFATPHKIPEGAESRSACALS